MSLVITNTGGVKIYTHFTLLLLSDGANQMNASVTTRQAGESKEMEEEWLSFEEPKTITILTLSDSMSDLVRHYDFPVSDAILDL
jgi:hypothetical protein